MRAEGLNQRALPCASQAELPSHRWRVVAPPSHVEVPPPHFSASGGGGAARGHRRSPATPNVFGWRVLDRRRWAPRTQEHGPSGHFACAHLCFERSAAVAGGTPGPLRPGARLLTVRRGGSDPTRSCPPASPPRAPPARGSKK
ncbi:uncharacterized protein Tco025E_07307 [Trypanosoma conorhini]|uniref:Uncharacterized protein n=1 Tax=Trypanosoma conorhini TaxID=83891 RepID=A0A3S5IRM8_9TRYP|nr:uncharacterized protein Tco025E_07307 [Trypanosoma conorhini]RNF07714.1 hypothetical protein Tco025E_07307 [Trypanosoma conorhini]